jgi:glycosyltransferase involved in cell wall biosynthesis
MTKLKELSVFFPVVNEEENIETIVKKAIKVLEGLGLQYEIIVVNDGSTDKTEEVAKELSKENSRIRVITHQTNGGYGEALKTGFYNAKYDTIVYTDGDGQFDFSEVTRLIDKLDEGDLVIGYRIKRADRLIRRVFAKGWRLSVWIMFGLRLKDVDCGFKMVKKTVLDKIPKLQSTRGGMINAELAIKAKKFGFRVVQVGVNHYPRTKGKPTGANIRVIIQSYIDLLKLWWNLR